MEREECLICKAPLEYLEADTLMECKICHKKENSKTRCIHGHYVCNECHTQGLDSIIGLCMEETSKNPVEIIEKNTVAFYYYTIVPALAMSGNFSFANRIMSTKGVVKGIRKNEKGYFVDVEFEE